MLLHAKDNLQVPHLTMRALLLRLCGRPASRRQLQHEEGGEEEENTKSARMELTIWAESR